MSKLRCTCLLFLLLALVAGVPTAPSAADAEKLQSEAEHNMRQADATIEQLQTDMKRMDTFAEEVRRNLDEEARAKQDLSHALGYFHRQMQLSSDERDVSHSRVSRLEAEVVALQRKVHQLEGQVETCHKDKDMLTEANKRVVSMMSGAFASAQAVEQNLMVKGFNMSGVAS